MDDEYYDVAMQLNVVIEVSAKSKREAEEKLYSMDDEDLICLLAEQVHFIGMPDATTLN